jgi:hypothetical protein
MKANSSPMSVGDYCLDINSKKIIVNNDYQRKEGLWSGRARSFFIESILLEFPIPKLYVYARLDLKTRQTIKEIVDGQQRSQALVLFFNGKLTLSKHIETEELRGRRYNQLSDEWKTRFLAYSLPIDQFVGVPEDEVQQAFRRMNANKHAHSHSDAVRPPSDRQWILPVGRGSERIYSFRRKCYTFQKYAVSGND